MKRLRHAGNGLVFSLTLMALLLSGCDFLHGFRDADDSDDANFNPIPDTSGAVRLLVPEDIPTGPPFVAHFNRTFIPHNDRYAGLLFIRETACIPDDLNLLDPFHTAPEVLACELAVRGRAIGMIQRTIPSRSTSGMRAQAPCRSGS